MTPHHPTSNHPPGAAPRTPHQKGFTLPELLAVIAIMVLVMGFMGPAVNSIKDARGFDASLYQVADILNQARDHAIANNTYVWVGFFEENGDVQWERNKVTAGLGRIIISAVASTDGNRYSQTTNTLVANTVTNPTATQIRVTPISQLYKLPNIRLYDFSADPNLNTNWPIVPANYQVGNTAFGSTPVFWYPTNGTNAAVAYKFEKIIEFNPLGEASRMANNLTQPPAPWLGVGLRATRGTADDPTQAELPPSAIFIEGLIRKSQVFTP